MKNDLKNIYYGVAQKYKTDGKAGDITAGTPFIELTSDIDEEKVYINIYTISEICSFTENSSVIFKDDSSTDVKETPEEILELIKNKYI
jgi:hypothetical protein